MTAQSIIPVLDGGHVALEQFVGGDLGVVNAARVSFASRSDVMSERDEGLIKFLMRERHGSPFEHNSFTFNIRCPIFVAREWHRHRIASYNEVSGRYTKLDMGFYVPEVEDIRVRVGKPGAYTHEPAEELKARFTRVIMRQQMQAAVDLYEFLLEDGIAPEVARMVLPVSTYTQYLYTTNARSLMNFLSLRTAENAQQEIRAYAEVIETFFEVAMPITYAAWLDNGKVAP